MATKRVTSAQHATGVGAERALSSNLTAPTGAVAFDEADTVIIKAHTANTGPVYLGPTGLSAANGYELSPGESVAIDASELSAIFSFSAAAQTLSLLGTIRG